MLALYRQPHIKGFTTNPTLMRKAGVTDYRAFAQQVLAAIPDRPISFEVFSDEFDEMERQAREIADLGRQRLRQDSGDQHEAAPAYDLDATPLARRCQGERHGDHDARAGARGRRVA